MMNSLDEDAFKVARNVAVSSQIAAIQALLAISAFFLFSDASSDPYSRGLVAAVGAVVVFGAAAVPAKHPGVSVMGSLQFQMYVTIGNALTTLLLGAVDGVFLFLRAKELVATNVSHRTALLALEPTPLGLVGALVLTLTQCCAWPAVQRLGASAGPGIWCGVGMATSFLWGVWFFGEQVASAAASVAALALLAVGTALVAASQAEAASQLVQATFGRLLPSSCSSSSSSSSSSSPIWSIANEDGSTHEVELGLKRGERVGGNQENQRQQEEEEEEEEVGNSSNSSAGEEPQSRNKKGGLTLGVGVGFAVATGLFDGTLMTAFSAFRSTHSHQGDFLQPPAVVQQVAAAEALSYLLSFALALPIVALPLLCLLNAMPSFPLCGVSDPLRNASGICDNEGSGGGGGGGYARAGLGSFDEEDDDEDEEEEGEEDKGRLGDDSGKHQLRRGDEGGGGGGGGGGSNLTDEFEQVMLEEDDDGAAPSADQHSSRHNGGSSGEGSSGGRDRVGGRKTERLSFEDDDDDDGDRFATRRRRRRRADHQHRDESSDQLLVQLREGARSAGLTCGFLWAVGNFMGVHATLELGQAVGFPLTQVCVLVSAAWGIIGFGETPHPAARALFAFASLLVLSGAVLLSWQLPR